MVKRILAKSTAACKKPAKEMIVQTEPKIYVSDDINFFSRRGLQTRKKSRPADDYKDKP